MQVHGAFGDGDSQPHTAGFATARIVHAVEDLRPKLYAFTSFAGLPGQSLLLGYLCALVITYGRRRSGWASVLKITLLKFMVFGGANSR